MTNPLVAASPLLLLLAAPAASEQPAVPGAPGAMQVRFSQHIVIHVPRVTVATTTFSYRETAPIEYKEKKADRCVKVDQLAGAAITRTDSVDLVMKGGKRLRAKLGNECPALDFYSGFYVKPTRDGMICADRDSFRLRSGAECEIEAFKTLVPVAMKRDPERERDGR